MDKTPHMMMRQGHAEREAHQPTTREKAMLSERSTNAKPMYPSTATRPSSPVVAIAMTCVPCAAILTLSGHATAALGALGQQ